MGSFIGRPECELLCQLTLPQQQKGAEAQKPSFPSTGFGFGAGLPPTSWAGLGQPTAHRRRGTQAGGPTGRSWWSGHVPQLSHGKSRSSPGACRNLDPPPPARAPRFSLTRAGRSCLEASALAVRPVWSPFSRCLHSWLPPLPYRIVWPPLKCRPPEGSCEGGGGRKEAGGAERACACRLVRAWGPGCGDRGAGRAGTSFSWTCCF